MFVIQHKLIKKISRLVKSTTVLFDFIFNPNQIGTHNLTKNKGKKIKKIQIKKKNKPTE